MSDGLPFVRLVPFFGWMFAMPEWERERKGGRDTKVVCLCLSVWWPYIASYHWIFFFYFKNYHWRGDYLTISLSERNEITPCLRSGLCGSKWGFSSWKASCIGQGNQWEPTWKTYVHFFGPEYSTENFSLEFLYPLQDVEGSLDCYPNSAERYLEEAWSVMPADPLSHRTFCQGSHLVCVSSCHSGQY